MLHHSLFTYDLSLVPLQECQMKSAKFATIAQPWWFNKIAFANYI